MNNDYDYEDFDLGDFKLETETEPEPEKTGSRRRGRSPEQIRERQKTRLSIISMLIIIPVFALLTLYMLVWPKSTMSQIEKRTLASFPSFSISTYLSGDFTSDIATWFTDTVPNRDTLKNLGTSFKAVFGLPTSDDEIIFVNNVSKKTGTSGTTLADTASDDSEDDTEEAAEVTKTIEEAASSPETATMEATDTAAAEELSTDTSSAQTNVLSGTDSSDAKLEGSAGRRSKHVTTLSIADTEEEQTDYTKQDAEFDWSDGLLIVQVRGHYMVLGLCGYGYDTSYIEGVSDLKSHLDSSINVYSMPCPLASQFYTPANASEYTIDQSARFDEIADSMGDGVISINVCSVLAKHTDEDIYLRTDHHWSQLGAYYAARTFAETAGVPFADISTFEQGVNEGYIGSYYAYTEDYRVLNDPEDFVYYKQTEPVEAVYYDRYFNYRYTGELFVETDTANSYLMYMCGDDQIVKVKGTAGNGRKLVIIKDSYGNAEIPWYVGSFDEIYVVDVRYFELNLIDFINYVGATDVLFSMCSYSVVGGNAENIPVLLVQYQGQTIVDEALDE